MTDQGFPVTVAVARGDGSIEQVRVGTAYKSGEGFSLRLGELTIGSTPVQDAAPRRKAASGGGGDGMVFPPYGRSKSAPIVGASMQDLEYYANGSRRSLADPSKARWHDKEKVLLAAIEAEIARQRGSDSGSGGDEPPPPDDADAPF
jgi:hypothetical protein